MYALAVEHHQSHSFLCESQLQVFCVFDCHVSNLLIDIAGVCLAPNNAIVGQGNPFTKANNLFQIDLTQIPKQQITSASSATATQPAPEDTPVGTHQGLHRT